MPSHSAAHDTSRVVLRTRCLVSDSLLQADAAEVVFLTRAFDAWLRRERSIRDELAELIREPACHRLGASTCQERA